MRSAQPRKYRQLQTMLAFLAAGTWFLSPAADLEGQVIQGHVHDSETRRPVVSSTVALRDSLGAVILRTSTDDEGAYQFTAPAPGRYSLMAGGLGYRTSPTGEFQVVEGEATMVDIVLFPQPLELDPLSVEAKRQRVVAKLTEEGFYERQKQGLGSYLTPDQIRRWPAISVVDILRHAPFVEAQSMGVSGSQILIRKFGTCRPTIYVDARKLPPGWDIEYAVNPDDVVGVEVYRGATQVPLEWGGNESCGVILIWTNLGRGGGG